MYLSCLLEGEQAASTSVAVYSIDRLRTGVHEHGPRSVSPSFQ
eukprot:SAG31_NODE_36298_length_314_cov_1.213953_1_plen_42_part_01